MSASAALALRKAIRATLAGDVALASLLGGVNIFDEAPRGVAPPYVTFGDWQTRDWSTASDEGAEHIFILNAWSSQPGARDALAIADRLRALLHDQPLALDGHLLVNLRFTQLQTRRETNGRINRTISRFRATTEPLSA
jgi:hypothetical protein